MKAKPTENSVKYCFSYIRFSSKKQELGSSLERQEPIAERVAKEMGWQYEPRFNAKSLGVSAYKGDNRKKLESICQAAKEGKIPQGSVMILEALDRATRLTLDEAQDLIKAILRSGIEIYTDSNKRHLTKASLNNVTDVIVTAVELDAAHQYSKKLSDRSDGGFKKLAERAKRGEKVYFGGSMPSYIKGVKDGKWVEDLEKKKLVAYIFEEYLKGQSKSAIVRKLNDNYLSGKGKSSLGRKDGRQWNGTTIRLILGNSAYTGDFTYKGIKYENYLPRIVSKEIFRTIQYLIKTHTKRRGGSPNGDVVSLFIGVGKCICGATLLCRKSEYWYKGRSIAHAYYQCNAARSNACKMQTKGYTIRSYDLEADFIMRLRKSPTELIGEAEVSKTDNTLVLRAEIENQNTIINNALFMLKKGVGVETISKIIDETRSEVDRLEKMLQEETALLLNTRNIKANIESLNQAMESAEITEDDVEMGMIFTNIKEDLKNMETRRKLVKIIPSIIKEIRVDPINGCYTIINHQGHESEVFNVR